MGNGDVSVPAHAAGFRARNVHDADAGHAADRRTDRRDAVFHRLGRFDETRDISTAAAYSRGAPLMAVGRFGGWAVGVVTLLTAQPLHRLAAQTDVPQTIDTIIIENGNIFDHPDATPGWVAHLANRLHVRTRQGVIRRRLLLNRGDPFDRARMEESERSLRTLGVFRSVRVDTVRAEPGGKLAVRAVTSDGWSTQPQASFSSTAGDKTWEVGLIERNFLGTATQMVVMYGRNPDRSHLDLDFVNQQFFGRHTMVVLRYRDLSDGRRGDWRFGLPFHETSAPYSLETYGEAAQERVLRFRDDALLDSTRHHLLRVGIIGGVAATATTHS